MVSQQPEHFEEASASQETAALASSYIDLSHHPDFSPSLSLYSTPGLSFAETPETNVSHDFATPHSPSFSACGDSFGNDYPIFAGASGAQYPHTGAYGTVTPESAAALQLMHTFGDLPATVTPDGLCISPDALLRLSPNADLACPPQAYNPTLFDSTLAVATPTKSAATAPVLNRAKSDTAVFAIPKLPRGRKRKSIDANAGADGSPVVTSASEVSLDTEDEKAALRAKNTESAARSRLRKKLELAEAQQRAHDIEEEFRLFKLESAKREDLAQRRIQTLEQQIQEISATLNRGFAPC